MKTTRGTKGMSNVDETREMQATPQESGEETSVPPTNRFCARMDPLRGNKLTDRPTDRPTDRANERRTTPIDLLGERQID